MDITTRRRNFFLFGNVSVEALLTEANHWLWCDNMSNCPLMWQWIYDLYYCLMLKLSSETLTIYYYWTGSSYLNGQMTPVLFSGIIDRFFWWKCYWSLVLNRVREINFGWDANLSCCCIASEFQSLSLLAFWILLSGLFQYSIPYFYSYGYPPLSRWVLTLVSTEWFSRCRPQTIVYKKLLSLSIN